MTAGWPGRTCPIGATRSGSALVEHFWAVVSSAWRGAAGPDAAIDAGPVRMLWPMRLLRIATPMVVAAAACAATISAADAATLKVVDAASSVVLPTGVFLPGAQASAVYFGGMRSPEGKARGFAMGFDDFPAGVTGSTASGMLALAFGSGPRIVVQSSGIARRSAARPLLGGTGQYLGARGVETRTRHHGTTEHTITYSLPARGTPRTREDYIMRLGKAVTTVRVGLNGIGNGRYLTGAFTTPTGQAAGTYVINSVLEYVYSGGLYEWYMGDATYTFTDGSTLRAVGPYQRATSAAAGALAASGRVVASGTGRYQGMRGQVVVSPVGANGTATHSFTLIK